MNILIIRAYPSIIDLKSNSYNQQEIGLATAFLVKGHQVGIVYFGGDKHSDETYELINGEMIQIYYRKARVVLSKIALYEKFDDLKESYDLLILNEYDQFETAKTLKKYPGKCIIYHGPYYDAFNKRYNMYNKAYDVMFLRTIKKANPIIFTKSKLAKEFLSDKGLEVCDYLGVGLDVTQLNKAVEQENPMKNDINKNNINLLYIGRLEERRNTIFMLECFREIIHKNDNYRLIIVGNGTDEYKEQVSKYIDKNGLGDYVTIKYKLEQKYLSFLYENSDIFLLPTSYEIWGMVLMEAMLYNCPVVTTFNGGSSSLIEDGVNGKIVDELDVEKWVKAITSENYDEDRLSKYNAKMIKEKCSWGSIADRMLEAFREERNSSGI